MKPNVLVLFGSLLLGVLVPIDARGEVGIPCADAAVASHRAEV